MKNSDEHHVVRRSAEMHNLQKEGRMTLLEMPLSNLLTDHYSCHQRSAARTTKRRAHQVRPMGTDDLLREATRALSLQELLLKHNLLMSEPLLCQLRPASPPGEAPDDTSQTYL
jgi:hypothetical protein